MLNSTPLPLSAGMKNAGRDDINPRQFVEALARGFALVNAVSKSSAPLGLSELSKETGLSISTIQRLTYTLQALGLIDRDQKSKKFRVGPRLIAMAFDVTRNLSIKNVAHPIMVDLASELNEVVGLGASSGHDIILLDIIIIKTQEILNINLSPGDTLPLHATASGKVILAFLPESQAEALLANELLAGITANTITSVPSLRDQLSEVRRCGYATAMDEGAYGLTTIAAPVRNNAGDVVAALAVLVPTMHAKEDAPIASFTRKVVEAADLISAGMGYVRE